MLLAALPGRAVQLAHAILAAGYDLVVPVSWGEELLADHAMRELEHAPSHAMVFCSCPLVRHRLLASGTEIVPHLLSCVAPPVATARYLRALQPDVAMRLTYLGACPGGEDNSIDAQQAPADFLAHLAQRGIAITRQPMVFESTVPPDRRRHWSLPGGAPSPDAMLARGLASRFVTIGPDIALDIAEAILSAERVLLDVAPTQGCACAGAVEVHAVEGSREAVIALEPPRSFLPVIDVEPRVGVAQPLPHLTAHATNRTMRPPSSSRTTSAQVTSIEDAARGRSDRRRLAVTPPHISTTEIRTRVSTRQASPAQAAARRQETAPIRAETPPSPERESVEHESSVPPVHAEPAPAIDVVAPAPAPSPATVEAAPAPEPSVAEPAPRAPEPAPAIVASHEVRRRTPTYEMRHVARTRSHSGETPRVPRAYGAVRSRVRGTESQEPSDAHESGHATNGATVVPVPAIEAPLTGEVSMPISVVVDSPVTPPTAPGMRAPDDPAPRPVQPPRIDRRQDERSAGRGWLVGIAVALLAGSVMYVLFGR